MLNYQTAQNYLLSLVNLPRQEYLKDPKDCGVYLKRLQFFLNLLDNPEKKIPHYIHVAGTSGKGSVCSFLHSILHEAGKKVGSITSPHPTYMFERWQIGDKYMSKKEFVDLVKFIKSKLDEYARKSPYDMISYSELMTAMGLLYFARKKVNWAVVEVGCGGRYDATNIIPRKDVAVITNVELDHTELLGKTKEKIAYEKAGIIKPKCRVFTMEDGKKALGVITKECKKLKVNLFPITCNLYPVLKQDLGGTKFKYQNENFFIPTIGKHQIKNAALVIEAARSLKIPKSKIKTGLAKAKQPLRMEIVSKNPLIILDGAHNPDKIKTTVSTLQHLSTTALKHSNINLIVGFSANKNVKKMIKQLSGLKPKAVACTRNTINPFRKVADPKDIAKQFKKLNPKAKIETFLDPKEALAWSKKTSDLILITGSVFLSGELKKVNSLTQKLFP